MYAYSDEKIEYSTELVIYVHRFELSQMSKPNKNDIVHRCFERIDI